MERRRFLMLAASAVLFAAGCGRRSGGRSDDEAAAPTSARDRDAAESGSQRTDGSADDGVGQPGGTNDEPPHDDLGAEADGGDAPTSDDPEPDPDGGKDTDPDSDPDVDPELLEAEPREWGERVTGVRTRLQTDEPVVALTFDACGGASGNGYDAALIDGLRAAAVPATLFLNARWIEANRALAEQLADDDLFELANHGTDHRPISVTGRSAYGITGTTSAQAVVDEVLGCQRLLEGLTGTAPRHFRAGTAYGDDVAVAIVQELGLEVVNFDVLGDAGATFDAVEVERALLACRPGSIALLHMNHPGSGTANGVAAAVPQLRERGFRFTTLGAHELA